MSGLGRINSLVGLWTEVRTERAECSRRVRHPGRHRIFTRLTEQSRNPLRGHGAEPLPPYLGSASPLDDQAVLDPRLPGLPSRGGRGSLRPVRRQRTMTARAVIDDDDGPCCGSSGLVRTGWEWYGLSGCLDAPP